MRIIGIDPGTAIVGYGVIDKDDNGEITLKDFGCIRTESTLTDSQRLNQIAQDISTLIKKWQPQKASIEKLFFSKNVKTAITVAQARGVLLQKLEENEIYQKEFTPNEIKISVCGHGTADKKMVQEMVKTILNLDFYPQPDDASDAIAAAICLANTMDI